MKSVAIFIRGDQHTTDNKFINPLTKLYPFIHNGPPKQLLHSTKFLHRVEHLLMDII